MHRKLIPGVTVITCTNKPNYFKNILANFKHQRYRKKELIIILNHDKMPLRRYRRMIRNHKNISVFKLPGRFTLGRCLNYGVRNSKYPLVAKFDDDDYYSPYYLTEQISALRRTGTDIVGKYAHLKYLQGKNWVIMTEPKQQRKFVTFLAGGTILFRKRVFKQVRFRNMTLGEDLNFLNRCKAKGFKLYATSPYNFVGIRRKNKSTHTWKQNDESLLPTSKIVLKSGRYRQLANRPIR